MEGTSGDAHSASGPARRQTPFPRCQGSRGPASLGGMWECSGLLGLSPVGDAEKLCGTHLRLGLALYTVGREKEVICHKLLFFTG